MRSLLAIATDLRAEAPCIAGGHSAPCSDCLLMIEAAEALEKINAQHGVKLRHVEIDEVAGRIANGAAIFCDATHPDTECAGWIWVCSLMVDHLGPHRCAGAAW